MHFIDNLKMNNIFNPERIYRVVKITLQQKKKLVRCRFFRLLAVDIVSLNSDGHSKTWPEVQSRFIKGSS